MTTTWRNSLAAVEAGDVVQLRSGGIRMTVGATDGPVATVYFFRDGQLHTERVNVSALEVVDNGQ